MTKTSPVSFSEYQESLLEKGMAISAACSHESYGEIIFNQIVKNPSCDLLTTMRVKVLEALSDRFVALTKMMQNHLKLSDENYLAKLVEENLLSPIIDNYKTCLMYVAAEDIAYFSGFEKPIS